MKRKILEKLMRQSAGLPAPPTVPKMPSMTRERFSTLADASIERATHSQVVYDGELIHLTKYDNIQNALNKYKLTSTSLNDYVLDEFSKWLTMPFISSMIGAFLDSENDFLSGGIKSPTTEQAVMLEEVFMLWKASERNTDFEVPESTAKRMDKYKISSDILKCDWKKTFFHLSDIYKFDFGGKYDFYLNYSGKKEDKWFNLNYNFLKRRVSEDIDSMFKTVDMERGDTWVINDMFDSKPFERLPDSRRDEFKRFVLSFIRKHFDGRMIFSWQSKPTKNSPDDDELGWIWFNSYEDYETITGGPDAWHEETKQVGSIINKLLTCLDMLKFSHEREFVTKNKSFTTNMRKAAKGLPRKKEKSTYKKLTSKKVIQLPRKLYLDYTRVKGSGTHASPKGHRRGEVQRTYRHEKFAASGLKDTTVTIAPCLVNGGPEKNEHTVVKVDPDSKLLEDYLSNYEKEYNPFA
tara:strand:+ start:5199 stop:6590 length:1392 start_codon:yes stop_codon:yes gene_type:complete